MLADVSSQLQADGRYFEDGGFHTVKVYSYNPNGFGLYCMAGNVAEWCSTAFDESQYEFGHDMNSDYEYEANGDHPVKKRLYERVVERYWILLE